MKFIKTRNGTAINADHLEAFKIYSSDGFAEIRAYATFDLEHADDFGCYFVLRLFRSDSERGNQLDPTEAAQAYLDTLIAELNTEDKPCGD